MTRGRNRTITPAPDTHEPDESDDWDFALDAFDADVDIEADDEASPVPGGSLYELTTSLQTLVHDLTRGMDTVSERLAALEERADPTPVSEAVLELGREMARGNTNIEQRLVALEQRPDTSHVVLASLQDVSGDVARWTADVSERLTTLEQQPEATDRLRSAVEDLAGSMVKATDRLAALESQRAETKDVLAAIEKSLAKVLAESPREAVLGIKAETAALHSDLEGVRVEIRKVNTRMQKLIEALFGGASH
jgi:chromosome segregation ATPase